MAISNEDAKRVIDEIEARTGNNRALEEVVMEEAEAADHPLHDEFDWDIDRAVRRDRLEQARKLIKRVRVIYVDPVRNQEVRVPAYIRNPTQPVGSYIPMAKLREDADVAMEVIRKEFDRAEAALTRAERVASVIPNMTEQVAAARERIAALLRRLAR